MNSGPLIEIRNLIEYAARNEGFASPDAGFGGNEADIVLERAGERFEVTIRRLEP